MSKPRILPVALGTISIIATTAVFAVHIVLAHSLSDASSSIATSSILASVLEVFILLLLAWFVSTYFGTPTPGSRWRSFTSIHFGLSLALCAVSAAASIAVIVCLSNNPPTLLPSRILGSTTAGFLAGSSVALGLSFAMQLIFLVAHYIAGRIHGDQGPLSLQTEDQRRSPLPEIKSIPYHETSPGASKIRGSTSLESKSPPGSSSGRSAADTMSSIRSSLSHVVRPISSKTRLLPGRARSGRRPASLDSVAHREQIHGDNAAANTADGFDSWDTSAVDPQNRQTVLETSSPPPGRFLETIPASPTTSRSPSPGTPLDLQPPASRRRSRSYSPTSLRTLQSSRSTFTTQHSSASESHIHPLFRSDSPTPPPMVTPGTIVTAAPNALQITDRQSIRTLSRMRSGSLPNAPSPLSRQGSFVDFKSPRGDRSDSATPELLTEEEGEDDDDDDDTETETDTVMGADEAERKMTPPIPDWVLSADPRSSFSGYRSRKQSDKGSEGQPSED